MHELSAKANPTEIAGMVSSSPKVHPVRFKPSPRSSLSCASREATPILTVEPSFVDDADFLLLLPSSLQASGSVTYSPSQVPSQLPPRIMRQNDPWSTSSNSTETSSHMLDIPRLSRKRSNDEGFVVLKKRLRSDRDYFDDMTASTFSFPVIAEAADEETIASYDTAAPSTPKPRPLSLELSPPRLGRSSPDQTFHFFRCNSALALPLLL